MNKFFIFPSINIDEKQGEKSYKGLAVPFVNSSDVTFVLIFPVEDRFAKMIDFSLNPDGKDDLEDDMALLHAYQTIIDSISTGDNYLSGIMMDYTCLPGQEQGWISSRLIINDTLGNLETIIEVQFIQAVVISAMLKKEVSITQQLLSYLTNENENSTSSDDTDSIKKESAKYPVDSKILNIAKEIMSTKDIDVIDDSDGSSSENSW